MCVCGGGGGGGGGGERGRRWEDSQSWRQRLSIVWPKQGSLVEWEPTLMSVL